MWRKLFKGFGAVVVMTIDTDGAVRFRFAKRLSNGNFLAKGIYSKTILYKDGAASLNYIRSWVEI